MNEWPKGEKLPTSPELLSQSIDKALTEKYQNLTFTTNPEDRFFMGFGDATEVSDYLASRGIDVVGLRIVTAPGNRSVSIFVHGRERPIYARYFPHPWEVESNY